MLTLLSLLSFSSSSPHRAGSTASEVARKRVMRCSPVTAFFIVSHVVFLRHVVLRHVVACHDITLAMRSHAHRRVHLCCKRFILPPQVLSSEALGMSESSATKLDLTSGAPLLQAEGILSGRPRPQQPPHHRRITGVFQT